MSSFKHHGPLHVSNSQIYLWACFIPFGRGHVGELHVHVYQSQHYIYACEVTVLDQFLTKNITGDSKNGIKVC